MKTLSALTIYGLFLFYSASAISQVESEPNDFIEEANSIDINEVAMVSGTIGTECIPGGNSDDFFHVIAPENGSLFLEVSASNTGLNNSVHQITAQDVNGDNFAVKFFQSGGENSIISTTLVMCLLQGDNYLKFSLSDMGMCADYSFTVTFSQAVYDVDEEPNDMPADAQMIYFGEPVTGQIGFGLDSNIDYFSVNADSDGNFSMDIQSEVGYPLQVPETLTVVLSDPIGTPLFFGAPSIGDESEPLLYSYSYGGLEPNGLYYILVSSTPCGVSYQIDYPSTNPIGIEDLTSSRITISPNPSSGMFYLRGSNIESVTIRDVHGKFIVSCLEERVDEVQWDASEMPSGIYYAEVKMTSGEVRTIKLLRDN